MATTTATPSRITMTARAFPLAAYFLLAYALSWLILVPAGLGLLPESSADILVWLSPLGPAVAAFVVIGLTGGRPAVGQLLRRLVQWRVPTEGAIPNHLRMAVRGHMRTAIRD